VTINNASVPNNDFGFYGQMDFGDLPDAYTMSRLWDEGARHVIAGPALGTAPTRDGDGKGNLSASGDTDEGVVRSGTVRWEPNATVTLDVNVTGGSGYLVAWINWNSGSGAGLDNDFDDAGEMIDFGMLSAGAHTLNLTIPSSYVTGREVFVRFRLYQSAPTSPSSRGVVYGGEVEDYYWPFTPTAITLREFNLRSNNGFSLLAILLAALLLLSGLVFWRVRRTAAQPVKTRRQGR